jgi:hypothetical protein
MDLRDAGIGYFGSPAAQLQRLMGSTDGFLRLRRWYSGAFFFSALNLL